MARPKKVEEKQLAPAVPQPVPIAAPQQPQQQPNLVGNNLQGRVIDVENFIKVRNSVSANAPNPALPLASMRTPITNIANITPAALPICLTRVGIKLPRPLPPPPNTTTTALFHERATVFHHTRLWRLAWPGTGSTQARPVLKGVSHSNSKTKRTGRAITPETPVLYHLLIHYPAQCTCNSQMHPSDPVLFHVITSNLFSAFAPPTTTSTPPQVPWLHLFTSPRRVAQLARVASIDMVPHQLPNH